LINLPIVNYYEHGTYLTVNHGHAAFMGVYGNLALAVLIFCCRYLIKPEVWRDRLFKQIFWSLNIGLSLMLVLDLFPVGFHQLSAVMEHGYWYARAEDYIQGEVFQALTWARIVGGLLFLFGGVIPLVHFLLTACRSLKTDPVTTQLEGVGLSETAG